VQVQDIVTFERQLINSVSGSTARFTDATLINFTDRATKWVISDILFPAARVTITTVPNQQGYSLPELYQIDRVYLAGQILVPTTLPTLGGEQAMIYDQSATGTPISGSDAPPGAGGMQQPQWSVQAPVAYPYVNNWGTPAPSAQPWFPGQRPRYYLRGGLIGIVPAPANVADLVIEGVLVPPKVVNLTDTLVVPENFLEAIAWKAVSYCRFSEDADRAMAAQASAAQMANAEIRTLRTWKRTYTGEDTGPKVTTYRRAYRIGERRNGDFYP
jgi:hypothetical protein